MKAEPLPWKRLRPGQYEAHDPRGSRWIISQDLNRKWEVYCNGALIAGWPHTLTEAKLTAEDEADPEVQELRERQRAARRARRRQAS